MSRASQQPAELATVIARAASFGGPAVAFAVVHVPRKHLRSTGESPPTGISGHYRETLAFDLPAGGFRLYTGFADAPASTMAGLGTVSPVPFPGGHLYRGIASLNPRFLYDAAQDHELLLSAGEERWTPDFADSLLWTEVLARLASAAADPVTAAPLLLLQSPVAPFRDWVSSATNRAGEPPKISRGAAIRVSVGVDGDNSRGRLALIEEAVRIAASYGLGLHLSDRRVGRVRGEWKEAVRHDIDVYRGLKNGLSGERPGQALLVTFVGPARVGSSAAVLGALAARGVGALGVTVASLQELAFINLVLPLPPSDGGKIESTVLPAAEALGLLAGRCSLGRGSSGSSGFGSSGAVEAGRAADYQACITGPFPWPGDDSRDDHPLWLQWQTPVGDNPSLTVIHEVVDEVIRELAASPNVRTAELDYCRTRMAGDKRLHSAKVSVELVAGIPPEDLPDVLSVLCRSTQASVEWRLPHGLKLAWRERWLARIKSTGVA
jgi:hypothetical protein